MEQGKGFFFYFVDGVVVCFCFNSSVNFAKHFCWLVIRLGSDLIKSVKIINKSCKKNRKKATETEKKNVNLDGNYQAPSGNREHRQLVLETLKKLP